MKTRTAAPKPVSSSGAIRASGPTGHGIPQSIHCGAASISPHSPSCASSMIRFPSASSVKSPFVNACG